MTPDQLFPIWSPAGSAWADWVKPVLFAHAAGIEPPASPLPPFDVRWVKPADESTAMVIDLPGPVSVSAGLALARLGYRAVPLFNAVPGPPGMHAHTAFALVEVWPIVAALVELATPLSTIELDPNAPPAFLLDSNRRTGRGAPLPGRFDNRSVSFPTDFPSASLLLHRGITRAILVQPNTSQPQPDLAHTLRAWQDAGIGIEIQRLDSPESQEPPTPISVAKPAFYRNLWRRLMVLARLRRSPLGGFGGILSESSVG